LARAAQGLRTFFAGKRGAGEAIVATRLKHIFKNGGVVRLESLELTVAVSANFFAELHRMFPPAKEPQRPLDFTTVGDASSTHAAQTGKASFLGIFRSAVSALASFLPLAWKEKAAQLPIRDVDSGDSDSEIDGPAPSSVPPIDQKQRLKKVPFTLTLFQFITRRMSIHSWITRLINRADVPAFERTWTEMPLYSGLGETMRPQRALRKLLCGLKLA
jgi:hypothetical protein